MILVDTNVWSELLKPVREPCVIRWLQENSEELVLSAIVLGELTFWAAKQADGRRRTETFDLLTAIDASVGSRFADFDSRDAATYGDLMARMRAAGTPLPALDGLIAAQAIARGYAVATRNVKDFARTGLRVVDPWQV